MISLGLFFLFHQLLSCSKQCSTAKFENKPKFRLGVGLRAVGRLSIRCVETLTHSLANFLNVVHSAISVSPLLLLLFCVGGMAGRRDNLCGECHHALGILTASIKQFLSIICAVKIAKSRHSLFHIHIYSQS